MVKGYPISSIGAVNLSGWSNEHFKKPVKPTVENPVVLRLDNRDSHVNIDIIDFFNKNGILM